MCHFLRNETGLIERAGRTIRQLFERVPRRTPKSPRIGPYGYYTGCLDLPNTDDAQFEPWTIYPARLLPS